MSALALDAAATRLKIKPRLRGVFHLFGFVIAVFGLGELAMAPQDGWRYVAGLVYAGSLALMLGVSALYHRPSWSRAARDRLRKADHVGIFFLVAGTYTPLAALVSPHTATVGLWGMWLGAAAGIAYAVLNSHGHRGLRALTYVVLGLCSAPLIFSLPQYIGWPRTLLLLAGAAVYLVGAAVYAKRWPNPRPSFLGYHEVFHLLVLLAAGRQFAVVWSVQQG